MNNNTFSSSSSSQQPEGDLDLLLNNLLDYCQDHRIYISSSITLRRSPGRGLGIYASRNVKKGEKLMHVPTRALLTVDSIPFSFASKEARREIPVHALLAAYLAFGLDDGRRDVSSGTKGKGEKNYERWMATWPRLDDFTSAMPMFWPSLGRMEVEESWRGIQKSKEPVRKKVKTEKTVDDGRLFPAAAPDTLDDDDTGSVVDVVVLHSPAIDGAWATLPNPPTTPQTTNKIRASSIPSLALDQLTKLDDHLTSLKKSLPHLAQFLPDSMTASRTAPEHWQFLHMWCCVNTRCFYYVKSGLPHPEDSNEAMALCPGMDLFNHVSEGGCSTRYDRTGYYIHADRDYAAGEELTLSYGSHTNDALWAEYGFMIEGGSNVKDGLRIDDVVLTGLGEDQKAVLQREGFLGDYWLKADGVCWRSEVVSWCGVVRDKQWRRMVQAGRFPGASEKVPGRNSGRAGLLGDPTAALQHSRQKVLGWIEMVNGEAEHNTLVLEAMSEDDVINAFVDSEEVLEAQDQNRPNIAAYRKEQAKQRHAMSVQRWRQISHLCLEAKTASQVN